MSFIQQQINSFLNLGACKEYPIMAKKSPVTSKQKAPIADSIPVASNPAVASPATPAVPVVQPTVTATETRKAEPRKLEIVKNDARKNIVPINLDDEIRQRAYELAERRGFVEGLENEDWLAAEREVLQRYRQQSA
jgi:Protein of unknown function (DUF2934)